MITTAAALSDSYDPERRWECSSSFGIGGRTFGNYEGEAYGNALQAAGNDVVITRYDGAFHGMLCFATALDQSKDMLGEVVDWLKVRLA